MSRGEPIASPVDPTLDGYKGQITLVPPRSTGAPSEVSDPSCADCGMEFRPANANTDLCPECRRKPEHRQRRVSSNREEAINRAEERWERTRQKWGRQ